MRTMTEKGKTFVIVPIEKYEQLILRDEDKADVAAFDAAIKRGEESFPITLFDAIDRGENPIKVFRTYRKIQQGDLAVTVNISKAYMSQIEKGKRDGNPKLIRQIAEILSVPMDMLI